ncbi:hypothetical protein ACUL41_18995 [Virgibacillus natechei]|uniref:hypothetical protein n=1 Tax=Virgibacillus sp. CBA3643 TaxID=2942278 RepID=UPI0035A325AC
MFKKLKTLMGLIMCFYVILYIGLMVLIDLDHTTFSTISMLSIFVPFLLIVIALLIINRKYIFKHKLGLKRGINLTTIIGVILPLICLIMIGLNEYNSHFNVNKWANNKEDRVYMLEDLMTNYELKGMNKKEVSNLLGKPTAQDGNKISYFLGNKGVIQIDNEVLEIWFNNNNLVTNYKVSTS